MSKKFWILLGILLFLSPVFAYLADLVNYSEPLENVAEHLGAEEHQDYEGILPDYSVPGLDMFSGTLISGVIGALITLAVAYGIAKVVASRE
ncbi:hypothetical protein Asulf_01879 [Archaeoglobus sulfaticallidus PM70-1]|uniref:PDGLE domain-containing protein n=1 Tax=Archaeoglobus sulfaticallidus PM70-1 TaxID=387631 RepID=N0BNF3_9EURY|nr:PDGLE domain-containing protein [Archaeoglobus sulfaticallidus]AGK61845.1 hypothetical protein Asulf_01879 [Archaeoglobus sulfaticallidus PM70-1]